jgi:hypothetical protein
MKHKKGKTIEAFRSLRVKEDCAVKTGKNNLDDRDLLLLLLGMIWCTPPFHWVSGRWAFLVVPLTNFIFFPPWAWVSRVLLVIPAVPPAGAFAFVTPRTSRTAIIQFMFSVSIMIAIPSATVMIAVIIIVPASFAPLLVPGRSVSFVMSWGIILLTWTPNFIFSAGHQYLPEPLLLLHSVKWGVSQLGQAPLIFADFCWFADFYRDLPGNDVRKSREIPFFPLPAWSEAAC